MLRIKTTQVKPLAVTKGLQLHWSYFTSYATGQTNKHLQHLLYCVWQVSCTHLCMCICLCVRSITSISKFLSTLCLNTSCLGAEGMSQPLGPLAALTGHLDSVPSTTWNLTIIFDSTSSSSGISFWLLGALHSHIHTHNLK